jgi:aldehyde dehydrogenase (NAD+)
MDYISVFNAQKEFVRSGRTSDTVFRKGILIRLRDLLKSNEGKLYDAVYEDFRKSGFDTYATELSMIYSEIKYFLKNLDRIAKPRRCRTNLANMPGKFRIYNDPLGSVLIIGAWNYPYQLTLLPAIDAIAAGNACILKPSELPSGTMHLIAEIVNDNFSPDILYVAEGGVPETTELLKIRFDKIFFTGSPRVGKTVYEAAASNLVPVTLELGGKSPVIVTASADLETAAKRIIWGKFLNAGQTCVAPDYLLVEDSVKDEFLQLALKWLKKFSYADGADNYVRIINKKNFDRILGLIDPDKVYFGGKSDEKTFYIEPTVMTGVGWDDKVMGEEIFGPVLPVISFSSLEDVLDRICRMEKPLSAYIFSNDKSEVKMFLDRVSFGGGCVNDVVMHLVNMDVPFGGVGNSGIGNYHGKYGFDCFSHKKAVLKKSLHFEPNMKYPPYTGGKLAWIKRLM